MTDDSSPTKVLDKLAADVARVAVARGSAPSQVHSLCVSVLYNFLVYQKKDIGVFYLQKIGYRTCTLSQKI